MTETDEVWVLTFRVMATETPVRSRINRLLKYAEHRGLKCEHIGGPEELPRWREWLASIQGRLDRLEQLMREEQCARKKGKPRNEPG